MSRSAVKEEARIGLARSAREAERHVPSPGSYALFTFVNNAYSRKRSGKDSTDALRA